MEVEGNAEATCTGVDLPPKAVLNEVEWEAESERNEHSNHKDCLIFWSIDLLGDELGWLIHYITEGFECLNQVCVERDDLFYWELFVYVGPHFSRFILLIIYPITYY